LSRVEDAHFEPARRTSANGWAVLTLTILPAILMFLMAQRYIVAGLTAGAVKG
jgi:ABC-type glycerol-3-phosphate transport system permease component